MVTAKSLFLPARRAPFALAVAAEHLRREQERLQERPRGEASRERAEERDGAGRVTKPPDIVDERQTVHVHMNGRDQLKKAETTVRAPQPALFDAAPRRLRDAVRVEDFVDHHCACLDARGDAATATQV